MKTCVLHNYNEKAHNRICQLSHLELLKKRHYNLFYNNIKQFMLQNIESCPFSWPTSLQEVSVKVMAYQQATGTSWMDVLGLMILMIVILVVTVHHQKCAMIRDLILIKIHLMFFLDRYSLIYFNNYNVNFLHALIYIYMYQTGSIQGVLLIAILCQYFSVMRVVVISFFSMIIFSPWVVKFRILVEGGSKEGSPFWNIMIY